MNKNIYILLLILILIICIIYSFIKYKYFTIIDNFRDYNDLNDDNIKNMELQDLLVVFSNMNKDYKDLNSQQKIFYEKIFKRLNEEKKKN